MFLAAAGANLLTLMLMVWLSPEVVTAPVVAWITGGTLLFILLHLSVGDIWDDLP